MSNLTGGRACGRVRHSAAGKPKFAILCQCRACQQMTGSDHAAQFGHAAEAFRSDGPLAHWDHVGDAGYGVRRFFCPAWGTAIFSTTTRTADVVMALTATPGDPARVPPTTIIFEGERIPWDHATIAAVQ